MMACRRADARGAARTARCSVGSTEGTDVQRTKSLVERRVRGDEGEQLIGSQMVTQSALFRTRYLDQLAANEGPSGYVHAFPCVPRHDASLRNPAVSSGGRVFICGQRFLGRAKENRNSSAIGQNRYSNDLGRFQMGVERWKVGWKGRKWRWAFRTAGGVAS